MKALCVFLAVVMAAPPPVSAGVFNFLRRGRTSGGGRYGHCGQSWCTMCHRNYPNSPHSQAYWASRRPAQRTAQRVVQQPVITRPAPRVVQAPQVVPAPSNVQVKPGPAAVDSGNRTVPAPAAWSPAVESAPVVESAEFGPTPAAAVEALLRIADLQPGQTLYDLGCGDGRVVAAAAALEGVSAVGVEIDSSQVKRAQAATQGLERALIDYGDATLADLSAADVVYLYHGSEQDLEQFDNLQGVGKVISFCHDIPQLPTYKVQVYPPSGEPFTFFVYERAAGGDVPLAWVSAN